MTEDIHSVGDALRKDHRVFERLADALDRCRLRQGPEMRRLVAETLDVLEPALAAHRAVESAALTRGPEPRPSGWGRSLLTAEIQRDGIASLVKDLRILASDPARYRLEHLASLAFLLSKGLREHAAYEEESLWKELPALERAAPPEALGALRRVESMLGRL